jgi:NADH-quinone oxidoreductase subunit L
MTGEKEDTDVGFPGPKHQIAERARPMAVAMAALGLASIFGGLVQVPGVDHVIDTFLAPTFEDSPLHDIHVSTAGAWAGLAVGGVLGLLGIATAYYLYVAAPQTPERLRARAHAVYTFLVNKWYFDELYDTLVYRPLIAIGRFTNAVLERVVVQGIVTGTVVAVRGIGTVVRGAQSGFVRAYALLLVGGFAALGLYFLIVSS